MRDKFKVLDELLDAIDKAPFLQKAIMIKPAVAVTREILVEMAAELEQLKQKLQRYEESENA